MKIKASEVLELFRLLSEKAGEPLDYKGLKVIANDMGDAVSQRFLFDKLNEVKKDEKDTVTIIDGKLEPILQYLEFKTFKDFQSFLKNPIPEILKSCEGVWINYLRQNTSQGYVLSSPVKIYQDDQKMVFILKGPNFDYSGNIHYSNGCFYCHFKNKNGKQFHHVYKVGSRISPKVLQGVFSGISTSNEPIAGRTVLIKQETSFNKIENVKYKVGDLMDSQDTEFQAIGKYFDKYSENNIALKRVITYDHEDLLE